MKPNASCPVVSVHKTHTALIQSAAERRFGLPYVFLTARRDASPHLSRHTMGESSG